jgi:hypothetical protein
MTNLYRITVRQTEYLEYSVEADSIDEAQLCMASDDRPVARSYNRDWEIVSIEKRKSIHS